MVQGTSFTFATPLASGQTYDVTVQDQPMPPSQTCTVSGGQGTVAAADVTSVAIACTTDTFTVGGTLSGLATGDAVVLENDGGDALPLTANGAFTFATRVASLGMYEVTAMTPTGPTAERCTVANDHGTIFTSDVSSVTVTCTPSPLLTVGGIISGLTTGEKVVLQDNGGDDLTVAAGAPSFTFATPVASGTPYAVTVKTQPSKGTCHVIDGSGTIGATPVTNVTVTCGNDYFVNVATGSNSGSGTSAAAPWKTITYAISKVPAAGGILNVAPGTYDAAAGEVFPLEPRSNQTLLGDPANHGNGATPTILTGWGTYVVAGGYWANLTFGSVMAVAPGTTGIAIRGFQIVTPDVDDAESLEGVIVDGASVTLGEDMVYQADDTSIFEVNGSNLVVVNCVVEGGVGLSANDPGTKVRARNSTFSPGLGVDYPNGVTAVLGSTVDLGTASDPGGNDLASGGGIALAVGTTVTVLASGNTWQPNVQGASATGTYPAQLVNGPVNQLNGNNYEIGTGGSIQF